MWYKIKEKITSLTFLDALRIIFISLFIIISLSMCDVIELSRATIIKLALVGIVTWFIRLEFAIDEMLKRDSIRITRTHLNEDGSEEISHWIVKLWREK